MKQNYYYILGLDEGATLKEIKLAYRKLSKKFHPDLNPGDKFFEKKFKDINEAYEYLVKHFDENIDITELPRIKYFQVSNENISINGNVTFSWDTAFSDKCHINIFAIIQ